jgi:hypothetical protein
MRSYLVELPCGCRYDIDSSFCPEGRRLFEAAFYANYRLEHYAGGLRISEEIQRLREDRDIKRKAYYLHMGWR